MTVSIETEDFVAALKAAQVTTFTGKDDPLMRCVYLTTTRAEVGDEPGEHDVLVAVSGDRIVWGQYVCQVDGQLDHPIVLDIAANRWIISSVTAAKKNMQELEGKNAVCTVTLSLTSAAGGGERLLVQTMTDGIRGEKDLESILPLELGEYPVDAADMYLSGRPFSEAGTDYSELPDDGSVMGFDSSATAVMDKIGATLKDVVLQYPISHPAGRRILTCGESWRGSVPGYAFTSEQVVPVAEYIDITGSGDEQDESADATADSQSSGDAE